MNKTNITLLNSAYKHIVGKTKLPSKEVSELNVLKNEEFGLQLLIDWQSEFLTVIGQYMDIAWRGLIDKLRVEVIAMDSTGDKDLSEHFQLMLVDYVLDDDKNLVADKLLDSKSMLSVENQQLVYLVGKIPENFSDNQVNLKFNVYFSKEYEDEQLIAERHVKVHVARVSLPDLKDSGFYMDLWQHPCNWARIYNVPYYGEEHMQIIDNYLQGMAKLGQKVCNLIISDYPWAGQQCFKVEENHMNLFELNIVKVYKNQAGKIVCDFKAMDQYLEIAKKHGMLDEINIFGVIGNWEAYLFGNPLTDFKDPIRISYYDESTRTFRYLTTREELKTYLTLVFDHLKDLGLWDKTLIMSDEPNNVELFQASEQLLKEANHGKNISLKCAIHDQEFLQAYGENIKSVSLNTCELIKNKSRLDLLKENIHRKGGQTTWFSCCFPQSLNIFLKSPLIESRLIGWFTYYMEMDGFLRWAYGIWPGDVMKNASYKKEKWAAGDMYFVYPGKNGKPIESLRLKNMVYGIQDWMLLKESEKVLGGTSITQKLEQLLGNKNDMKFIPERDVEMNYSLDYQQYMQLRDWLIMNLSREKDL